MSKLLTPLELKVMNILWRLKKAFVKDLLENWELEDGEEKKPAYNTVSTTIRILENKTYIGHEAFGRTHQYFPLISKADYQKKLLSNIVDKAFAGSVTSLVSALVDSEKVSNDELDALQELINQSKG